MRVLNYEEKGQFIWFKTLTFRINLVCLEFSWLDIGTIYRGSKNEQKVHTIPKMLQSNNLEPSWHSKCIVE